MQRGWYLDNQHSKGYFFYFLFFYRRVGSICRILCEPQCMQNTVWVSTCIKYYKSLNIFSILQKAQQINSWLKNENTSGIPKENMLTK